MMPESCGLKLAIWRRPDGKKMTNNFNGLDWCWDGERQRSKGANHECRGVWKGAKKMDNTGFEPVTFHKAHLECQCEAKIIPLDQLPLD